MSKKFLTLTSDVNTFWRRFASCQFIQIRTMCSAKTPSLHEILKPVSWLVGKWRSEAGQGKYPTIQDFTYGEELEFRNIGQPNLQVRADSWMGDKMMHRESGFLRVQPKSVNVALLLSHNTGLSEVEEGTVNGTEIKLTSHSMGRLTFGKEPAVKKIVREFRLLDNNCLEQVIFMETSNTTLTEHLRIRYHKVHDDINLALAKD